ncbi:FecR domain-containing protein [Sphingobium sp. CR2-8]|uniref:FecR family protein n=1 Tax=Sphingobium sp. CR2-8 TaxID=1306534 RepID=UPI002DB65715|nr:FecR domain-containing protein [Sphingobium sp. CR2-8]MEC3909159.1 FecR domain-containing protein [Sphingobium sp. CR2-8]
MSAEFDRWRANPAHDAAYARVKAGQDAVRGMADAPEILSLRQQTLARLALRGKASDRSAGVTTVALLLALAVVVIPIYTLYRSASSERPESVKSAQVAFPDAQQFQTAVGQKLTLALGDGSRVTLNTASRIRVAYTASERRVMLDAGQAWFEVAKQKDRPFLVFAGGQRVEAHGTAFDVRIKQDETEIMLAEGKVSVRPARSTSEAVDIAMVPRQLLIVGPAGATLRPVKNPADWAGWREGIIRFDNLPLSQAVAEMNRYSEMQLVLADDKTAQIKVSGAFHTGSFQAFTEALAIGFHVESRPGQHGRIMLRHVSR